MSRTSNAIKRFVCIARENAVMVNTVLLRCTGHYCNVSYILTSAHRVKVFYTNSLVIILLHAH